MNDYEVLNDYAKIELDDAGAFSAKSGDSATDGILVALPDELMFFGYYSFAFENSFMADKLPVLLDYWKQRIGRRVYWLSLAEKGAILKEENGKRYAYIKITSLMASSKPELQAESILDARGGSYAA